MADTNTKTLEMIFTTSGGKGPERWSDAGGSADSNGHYYCQKCVFQYQWRSGDRQRSANPPVGNQ